MEKDVLLLQHCWSKNVEELSRLSETSWH